MPNIIINPDVHGRNFWKYSQEKINEFDKVVFLGDYTDPYNHEDISKEMVISSLSEIIDFKQKYPDKVVLLLGNHDLGGYILQDLPKCRFDYKNHNKISELFLNNIELFDLIHTENINGKNVIFSHAGILNDWLKNTKKTLNLTDTLEVSSALNELLHKRDFKTLTTLLNAISWYRGGYSQFGSVVWADVDEHKTSAPIPDVYQIFGHTMQYPNFKPIITENYACLDCLRPFILTENGDICEIEKQEKSTD